MNKDTKDITPETHHCKKDYTALFTPKWVSARSVAHSGSSWCCIDIAFLNSIQYCYDELYMVFGFGSLNHYIS